MAGRVEFELTTRNQSERKPRVESGHMRMLVMGDFSAYGSIAGSESRPQISQRTLHRIDLDSIDTVLSLLAPRLELALDGDATERLSFTCIEDFHPDCVCSRIPRFQEMLALRDRLQQKDSYPEAVRQLRAMTTPSLANGSTATSRTDPADRESAESDAATLQRLLGKPVAGTAATGSRPPSLAEKLIAEAAKSDFVPDPEIGQQVCLDAVNRLQAELMRRILHDPGFRSLEAHWRGLDFLVRQLELDEELQIWLLDVTKEELFEDMARSAWDPTQTQLHSALLDESASFGKQPWSLLLGHYCFDNSENDCALLAVLGGLGRSAGAPFLAQASPTILGCASLAECPDPRDWITVERQEQERWMTLRQTPEARCIGLALPRIILRLPYGPDTEEIDGFAFRELQGVADHETLLWGNAAYVCAALIGRQFTAASHGAQKSDLQDIENLPVYSYKTGNEGRMLPCAEVFLTESAVVAMLELGLMPIVNPKNTDRVRLPCLQSLADTPLPIHAGLG